MNKNLYLSWLSTKVKDTPLDGPSAKQQINESRGERSFYRAIIAQLIGNRPSGTEGKKNSDNESLTLEPVSTKGQLEKQQPRSSIKQPQVPPLWSYASKNSLGLGSNAVYEENIEENAGAIVLRSAAKSGAIVRSVPSGTKRVANTALGTRRPTALATRRPTALATRTPLATIRPGIGGPIDTRDTARVVGRTPIGGPIQIRNGNGLVPSGGKPIVPTGGSSPKPVGSSNPLGGLGPSRARPASKMVKSKRPGQENSDNYPSGFNAVSVEPGSGETQGGDRIYEQNNRILARIRTPVSTSGNAVKRTTRIPLKLEENSLKSLINMHVDKFLNSRHGKQLKSEAGELLTNKD